FDQPRHAVLLQHTDSVAFLQRSNGHKQRANNSVGGMNQPTPMPEEPQIFALSCCTAARPTRISRAFCAVRLLATFRLSEGECFMAHIIHYLPVVFNLRSKIRTEKSFRQNNCPPERKSPRRYPPSPSAVAKALADKWLWRTSSFGG
ncbi:MAG: hypothetical protein J6T51_02770, partial [Kiritimatiellae bacterium]|nr:hypothetical protein [Kiritimatiellia bacterium]